MTDAYRNERDTLERRLSELHEENRRLRAQRNPWSKIRSFFLVFLAVLALVPAGCAGCVCGLTHPTVRACGR